MSRGTGNSGPSLVSMMRRVARIVFGAQSFHTKAIAHHQSIKAPKVSRSTCRAPASATKLASASWARALAALEGLGILAAQRDSNPCLHLERVIKLVAAGGVRRVPAGQNRFSDLARSASCHRMPSNGLANGLASVPRERLDGAVPAVGGTLSPRPLLLGCVLFRDRCSGRPRIGKSGAPRSALPGTMIEVSQLDPAPPETSWRCVRTKSALGYIQRSDQALRGHRPQNAMTSSSGAILLECSSKSFFQLPAFPITRFC